MKIDKRPFYVWVVVALAIINIILPIFLMEFFNEAYVSDFTFLLIVAGISLFVSIIPNLISKSTFTWKNYLGYGIPILLLLPTLYYMYDAHTCYGKFCGADPFFNILAFGISAIIFAVLYAICTYGVKWNIKFILSVMLLEIILLGYTLYLILLSFHKIF